MRERKTKLDKKKKKGKEALDLIKKVGLLLFSLVLHGVAVFIIFRVWQPVADWYLSRDPIRGIDLYNSASYVQYILDYSSKIFSGWKYIWYLGSPFGLDYPVLYFYLMSIFAQSYGLIEGIMIFVVIVAFLIGVFSYFLFFELSGNRALAGLLSLGVLFSVNIYPAMVWAGGIPYFASQAILPLTLYFVIKYRKTKHFRWFLLAGLSTGLGVLGHPQAVIIYALPTSLVFLFLWVDEKIPLFSFQKVREALGYIGLVLLLSAVVFSKLFYGTWAVVSQSFSTILEPRTLPSYDSQQVQIEEDIRQWSLSQVDLVWSHTNSLLWILGIVCFAIFFISFVVRKDRFAAICRFLAAFIPPFAVIISVMLYARGHIPFIGGWYKVFWPIPILVGMFAAWMWGEGQGFVMKLPIFQRKDFLPFKAVFLLILNLLVISVALVVFPKFAVGVIEKVDLKSTSSSALPTRLNAVDLSRRNSALDSMTPSWLSNDDFNYRLYEIDATVNIWWSVHNKMPLARGYIDPAVSDNGSMFWLNAAIGRGAEGGDSSLEEDWGVDSDIVMKNLLYLLDWYGIKYLEGNHASLASPSQLSPQILTGDYIEKEESVDLVGHYLHTNEDTFVWMPEGVETLNYFSLKDEYVSPILYATDVPVILIIGDDQAYDVISRLFGDLGLGPQQLIFVKGPKYLDKVNVHDLLFFDAIVLYGYDYKNHGKAWSMIESYLKNGRSVFIDTGREVKESNSVNLPESFSKELPGAFPIIQTVREGMGYRWEAVIHSDDFAKNVNINDFSSLDFDGEEWNISYPPNGVDDIDEGGEVILSHKDKPVMVRGNNFGGKVVWSGYNAFYHALREHNVDELQFLYNVFSWLIPLEKVVPVSTDSVWESPELRRISVGGAKGVIFKEQAYSGWEARVKDGGELEVFTAGPTYPGFIYIPVPSEFRNSEVILHYKGETKYKLYAFVSLVTLLLVLDYIILRGHVMTRFLRFLTKRAHRRASHWWNRDEYE